MEAALPCDSVFYNALYEDIETLLSDLGPNWSRAELEPVRQDIENGQLDLATEQLAAACVLLNKPLTSDLVARIGALAERQGLASSVHLQRLRGRAAELGI